MDALSELLNAVKLSGALFFNAQCAAPWCFRSPPSSAFTPYVAATGSHVIEFHLVTEGRGYIRVRDETITFEAGDIVMLPHGDPHMMGNGVGGKPLDGEQNLSGLLSGEIMLSSFGGSGEETRLVCGYLAADARLLQPLLAGLPHVLRVSIRSDPSGEWLENMIRHAVLQAGNSAPGSRVIQARLAEVLFAEALRRYLVDLPAGRSGWLAGAADPAVGRALAAMHNRPAHDWTLEALVAEVGLSRSALTERFARYLGQGPMAYLTDWRLELGAEMLRTTSRSVLQIASEVGYESEAAFNRAFKRRFSEPPGRYRQQWRTQSRGEAVEE